MFYRRFPAKRWKGFRLWACDGTGLRLPNESWVGDAFGWHQNQHSRVPSTRLLCYYDVLNKILVKIALHPREFAEVTMACPAIKDIPTDVIVIYDRGFASYAVIYLHMFYGSHCIIRLKKDFNPTVVDFLQSGAREVLVETPLPERATRSLRKLGHKVSRKDTIRYRLIRVELPNGDMEVLMTSLLHRRRYHYRHFAGLYNSRWGVETCFHILKSYFQAAVFASYTTESIRQEVWAMFALFNIQSMCMASMEKELVLKTQGRKYRYQLNRNIGLGYLKRFLPPLLLDGHKRWWARVKELLALLLSALEPIRPDKNRVRKRRLMRGAERHIYEPNYKPSL